MDNKENILDELTNFEKRKPTEIPQILDDYLVKIAKTGDTVFPWSKLKPLFMHKLEKVIAEFHVTCTTDDLPPCPNVERFTFDAMKDKLVEAIDKFSSAPFTIQRLCELITAPRKHYKQTEKFMRGLEKNVLVVSTVEPGCSHIFACDCSRKRSDHQNTALMNGTVDTPTALNGVDNENEVFEDANEHLSPSEHQDGDRELSELDKVLSLNDSDEESGEADMKEVDVDENASSDNVSTCPDIDVDEITPEPTAEEDQDPDIKSASTDKEGMPSETSNSDNTVSSSTHTTTFTSDAVSEECLKKVRSENLLSEVSESEASEGLSDVDEICKDDKESSDDLSESASDIGESTSLVPEPPANNMEDTRAYGEAKIAFEENGTAPPSQEDTIKPSERDDITDKFETIDSSSSEDAETGKSDPEEIKNITAVLPKKVEHLNDVQTSEQATSSDNDVSDTTNIKPSDTFQDDKVNTTDSYKDNDCTEMPSSSSTTVRNIVVHSSTTEEVTLMETLNEVSNADEVAKDEAMETPVFDDSVQVDDLSTPSQQSEASDLPLPPLPSTEATAMLSSTSSASDSSLPSITSSSSSTLELHMSSSLDTISNDLNGEVSKQNPNEIGDGPPESSGVVARERLKMDEQEPMELD